MQEWLEMRAVPAACEGWGPDSYLATVSGYTRKLHRAIPPRNSLARLAFTFPNVLMLAARLLSGPTCQTVPIVCRDATEKLNMSFMSVAYKTIPFPIQKTKPVTKQGWHSCTGTRQASWRREAKAFTYLSNSIGSVWKVLC